MKTLQSILNNPERRLSAEEMKEIKGGSDSQHCNCTFYFDDFEDSVSMSGSSGVGDCFDAGIALSRYYEGIYDAVICE